MRAPRFVAGLLGLAVLLTLAPAALAAPASASAGGTGARTGAIPGRYIVTLVEGADPAAVARDYRARGAELDHVYGAALRGFAGAFPPGLVDRLEADARVARVEADGWVHATTTTQSNATWGLDRVDQRALPLNGTYSYDTAGAGVTAYVLDTGIRATHVDFGGRVSGGYTAIGDGRGTDDCHGHGTHVAGTIGGATYGVAKAVRLVPVRVLDCNGSGTWSGVIAGVDWVTRNAAEPAVANMSLGGGANTSVDDAVRRSIAAGVVYALAAGNDSGVDACTKSPARVTEGLTVGATTKTDARASFSNIGSCLDLFAPGSGITAPWISSDTSTSTISGTSMATPHVAGAAALYLATNTSASVTDVNAAVLGNATAGVVGDEGARSPDLLLYSRFATEPVVVTPPATPTGFTATAASSSRIDLAWTDVADEASYTLSAVADGKQVLSVTLPAGTTSYPHTGLTASTTYAYELTATNTGGTSIPATASAQTHAAPEPEPVPEPAGISLTATAYKVKGVKYVDLDWSGTTVTNVAVYRDGAVVTTTTNDGAHTDRVGGKGGGSHTYRVCEAGTSTCSADVTVTF